MMRTVSDRTCNELLDFLLLLQRLGLFDQLDLILRIIKKSHKTLKRINSSRH